MTRLVFAALGLLLAGFVAGYDLGAKAERKLSKFEARWACEGGK